jgi:hypothetical protein
LAQGWRVPGRNAKQLVAAGVDLRTTAGCAASGVGGRKMLRSWRAPPLLGSGAAAGDGGGRYSWGHCGDQHAVPAQGPGCPQCPDHPCPECETDDERRARRRGRTRPGSWCSWRISSTRMRRGSVDLGGVLSWSRQHATATSGRRSTAEPDREHFHISRTAGRSSRTLQDPVTAVACRVGPECGPTVRPGGAAPCRRQHVGGATAAAGGSTRAQRQRRGQVPDPAGSGISPRSQRGTAAGAGDHPRVQVGVDALDVADSDHELVIRVRCTSVVYHALARQGSAGVAGG